MDPRLKASHVGLKRGRRRGSVSGGGGRAIDLGAGGASEAEMSWGTRVPLRLFFFFSELVREMRRREGVKWEKEYIYN